MSEDPPPLLSVASVEDDAGATSGLPREFMQESARRLGILSLTVAAGGCFSISMKFVVRAGLGGTSHPHPELATFCHGALVILSMVMFGLSRRPKQCPYRLTNYGIAYWLIGAVALAVPAHWGTHLHQTIAGRVGWLGVWILIFPLAVPARTITNVVTASVAATMAPLVYGVWVLATGADPATFKVLGATFVPYYMCAALAVVSASGLYRLGKSLGKAQREMRELGSYKLLERFGQGGMGEVWKAEHRMLARPAAIKLIKPERLASGSEAERQGLITRFEREARATAALSSPHTIGLHDYGVTEEGVFYYVMELLEGIDLETLVVDVGPVCPSRTIHFLTQACASLAEAHEAGLIHRDVKPANIFCCRLGQVRDFVKLLDFGLVRPSPQDSSADDLRLTGQGHILGTPAFMAPEQARGQEIDARVDIYGLGCVGYWLLTARYVFESESVMDMVVDHMQTAPPPVSQRVGKPVPADLEAVLLACLAKDPADRPQTAEELARRLAACDVPAWSQESAQAWWNQHMQGRTREWEDVDPSAPTRTARIQIPAG